MYEPEMTVRLRGHSTRMPAAFRDTDSCHVEAFALEVLRRRSLSNPHALLKTLEKRAEIVGTTAVDHAGTRPFGAQR